MRLGTTTTPWAADRRRSKRSWHRSLPAPKGEIAAPLAGAPRRDDAGNVLLWLMDGTALRTTVSYPGIDLGWQIQTVGDFDGDGVADILWRYSDGTALAWLLDHGNVKRTVLYGVVDPLWRVQGTAPRQ